MITIVNIFNFIRMSNLEPSVFVQDDFDTIKRQIHVVKQYGLPSTYALKYDALMNEQYQNLLFDATDENDEIAVWWEITKDLCERAGVSFKGMDTEVFDERVNSAYCVGYTPDERCKLVDAYMKDFYEIFGYYPKTMGSWILDSVTISYAQETYGLIGFAICRDQMATDGFTLWGGWPNGLYTPSKKNLYIPSQTIEETIPVTMFRLLGPDPILCFEQNVRKGTSNVYTLEPTWYSGKEPKQIKWYFDTLIENEGAGIGYAQVGQENNFLWENICQGFEPQIKLMKELSEQGKLRVETMGESAKWFRGKYKLTPPLSWNASVELTERLCVGSEGLVLESQWYASRFFRLSFLAEQGYLRIRDWFLFREQYEDRYLHDKIHTEKSTHDALPLMFPQQWGNDSNRPYVRIMEQQNGNLVEAYGESHFKTVNETTVCAFLKTNNDMYQFTAKEDTLQLNANNHAFVLQFDTIPVYEKNQDGVVSFSHEGFSYDFVIKKGTLSYAGKDKLQIASEDGEILLLLSDCKKTEQSIFNPEYLKNPIPIDTWQPRWITNPMPLQKKPLMKPHFSHPNKCFDLNKGKQEIIVSSTEENTTISYQTQEGSWCQTTEQQKNLILTKDTTIQACSVSADGRVSEVATQTYKFGWKDVKLESNTHFDWRPVFDTRGIMGLLKEERGSGDWQDFHWIATLENLDFICELPEERLISKIEVGFLTNHRSGIIYPELLELYVGDDKEHLQLFDVLRLPEGPAKKEIECKDFGFTPNVKAKCIRFVAKRYDLMPQWCCFKGTPGIFTMADCLMIK